MKKKYIIAAALTVAIIMNLFMLLYPSVSNYVNSHNQSRAVAVYINDVKIMDNAKAQALFDAALEYNKNLRGKADRFKFTKEETAEYDELLNTGLGVMGILIVEKINVNLPIYHGTNEGVLQVGLGHLQGSSLPVGGTGTHSLIIGHRGLPSSKLLRNLNEMAEGDIFILHILNETLTYQVDQILVVEPDNVTSLYIDIDMDYCTLVTCTPYGINTHRLMVRGRRTDNAVYSGIETIYAGARELDKLFIILIFIILSVPVLLIITALTVKKIHSHNIWFVN